MWQNARAACYKAKKRGRSWPEREEKLRLEKSHCCILLFQNCHSADGMRQILSLLLFVALSCAAKPKRQQTTSEWDYRSEAEKVNMKGCANLTVVLDNWKFAIMTQFKNLLLYDHQTVLPDYGRIKSLSDALDDLYKEFNALKERLGELTTRFEGVESFVDEMNKGQSQPPAKMPIRVTQPEVEKPAVPVPARRRRIRILNGRKPTEPLTDGTQ